MVINSRWFELINIIIKRWKFNIIASLIKYKTVTIIVIIIIIYTIIIIKLIIIRKFR